MLYRAGSSDDMAAGTVTDITFAAVVIDADRSTPSRNNLASRPAANPNTPRENDLSCPSLTVKE